MMRPFAFCNRISCCFLLFLALLTSCSKPESKEVFKQERNKKIYAALRKFKRDMKEKGYHAAGIGEGIDHSTGKQNYIEVTFDIEELPSVDFARKIEVETLQKFQKYINEEKGIQDYVVEYPYPIKNIEISFISMHPKEGLFGVTNIKNRLIYFKSPEQPGPLINFHEETYEEAVRILEQKEGSLRVE